MRLAQALNQKPPAVTAESSVQTDHTSGEADGDAASDEAWAAGEELEMYAAIVDGLKAKLAEQSEAAETAKETERENIKLKGELQSMRKAYRIMLTEGDPDANKTGTGAPTLS